MCDIIYEIIEILVSLASIIGAIVSIVVYKGTVQRDKKILTIEQFGRLREKYSEGFPKDNDGIKEYLRDMEFFCVGINSGIYDLNILKKMSGKLLLSYYEKAEKYLRQKRKDGAFTEHAWSEYEAVMKKLKKKYKNN